MLKKFLFLLLVPLLALSEEYAFQGRHLIASYYDCDLGALTNIENLKKAMIGAVDASGATILSETNYHFEPDGLTMVVLLSESHASLHTYPEHGACFVDLFTCGSNCCAEGFDRFLRRYLKPKHVSREIIERS